MGHAIYMQRERRTMSFPETFKLHKRRMISVFARHVFRTGETTWRRKSACFVIPKANKKEQQFAKQPLGLH